MCKFPDHFVKITLSCFLMILMSVKGNGQAYNFNYLTIQKGLPQSQAFCITFDSNEHAWIGTQGGGLCRYDGVEYLYLTINDSLLSNRIYSITQIETELWIGQKGGVTVLDLNGNFKKNLNLPDQRLIVNDVIVYEDQHLFATDNGVFKVVGDNTELIADNPNVRNATIYQFLLNDKGELWLCTTDGFLNFEDPFKRLNRNSGMRSEHVECAVQFEKNIVLGTYEGGVYFYDGQIHQPEELEELNDKIVLSLYTSGKDELWIGTMNNGVYVYNTTEKSIQNFRTNNGLSGNHIKAITSDYWENIWIGTSGGGVSVFQNSPFIEYNSSSGLNGNYVFSVLNDSRNNLWLGTEGTGVMRINDTSKVLFDEEFGFYSEKVKCIFEDSDGDMWFGTEGKGVGFYDLSQKKDTIYSFYHSSGLKGSWVKAFAENERTGDIYIGTTDGGLYQVKKTREFPISAKFTVPKVRNGKIPKQIVALHFYENKLWFASRLGEYGFIANDEITVYNDPGKSFRNIAINGDEVWIGSKDNGILRLTIAENDSIDDKRWMTAASGEGIQSNNIYQLLYFNRQLWVGTEKGLDRLNLDSSNSVSASEHFGFQEGFEGVETNINAGSSDINGDLWFGTVNGLFVYKGRGVNKAQRKPPILRLTDFQIIFQSIEKTPYADCFDEGQITKSLLLPHDQNHISFIFKGIHYSYASNIKYRWKLDGIDRDWTPGTKINVATYPNLPPGKYVFSVQASIDETWEQEPIQISFAIDQPYWEKTWFKASYYSLIGLVLIMLVLLIFVRQRRKIKALNEKLKLEKNLLELEQKALRLQMNPHFIFNVLNSIHNQIILNDSDKARYALSKFSKLMRQVLENSREKFISIDDEIETLQNYVQLERLTSNVNIELEFEFDEDMDTTENILPPLMIQPFVENSIVHGLKGIEENGKITVSFKWIKENLLECAIRDNGIGRKKASEINAQKEVYHKSTALKVAQERLANLNKTDSFVPFEILDLLNEDGVAEGTLVIIRILV